MFELLIACKEKCGIKIMKTACVLHNFIRIRERRMYEPRSFATSDSVPLLLDVGSRINVIRSHYKVLAYVTNHLITLCNHKWRYLYKGDLQDYITKI